MLSFAIYVFILAIFFRNLDFASISNDTWLIVLAILLSIDVQIFKWISKK